MKVDYEIELRFVDPKTSKDYLIETRDVDLYDKEGDLIGDINEYVDRYRNLELDGYDLYNFLHFSVSEGQTPRSNAVERLKRKIGEQTFDKYLSCFESTYDTDVEISLIVDDSYRFRTNGYNAQLDLLNDKGEINEVILDEPLNF